MHETMVAESVLRAIAEQAEKIGTKPISAVISCGQFNALNDEVMQFAFETAAAGTVWFTTDGQDPRLRQVAEAGTGAITLVAEDAPKRVLVP